MLRYSWGVSQNTDIYKYKMLHTHMYTIQRWHTYITGNLYGRVDWIFWLFPAFLTSVLRNLLKNVNGTCRMAVPATDRGSSLTNFGSWNSSSGLTEWARAGSVFKLWMVALSWVVFGGVLVNGRPLPCCSLQPPQGTLVAMRVWVLDNDGPWL